MRGSAERFDLVIVGGGTAGLVAAAGSAGLGARVALVERDRLGGECLWTGCVPSKGLVASARAAHLVGSADRFGLVPCRPAEGEPGVLASVREVRARIQPHDDPDRFRAMGVEVVEGEGRLVSGHVVEAAGRRLEGRKILLATGSRPAIPPVDGLREAGFVTHEDAFDRTALPGSAVILGGGAIGVEFAQAYRRLGVEVTLVEMAGRLLPREDREISAAVAELLREEGVTVRTGRRAVRAERRSDGTAVLVLEDAGGSREGEVGSVEAGEIFVAAGRSANVESLGLDEVGVEVGPDGIAVDDRLRTSLPHVFAAGDVIGGHRFTHVADHEARTVIRNALFPFTSAVDYTVIPWAIFTDPPVARVGLTEEEARERHGDGVAVVRYDLADLDRAITERRARGTVKIVVDRRGRILGGHLLGEDAGSVIMELALAVREDVKLGSLSDLVHPYPTMSEGLRRAADEYRRAGLTPLVRRWLDRWFRLARRLDL